MIMQLIMIDLSYITVEMRSVVATLTRLYNETSEALGGMHANPSKKREIEDNSKKIGSLFAKLNGGDLSPNAASKLRQLCQALDASDFASALHTQVFVACFLSHSTKVENREISVHFDFHFLCL